MATGNQTKTKYLLPIVAVGGTLVVLTWSGLRVWAARTLTAAQTERLKTEQRALDHLKSTLDKLPAYKLTFLGAKLLRIGDYQFAQTVLELATQKDRFYRDAFRYYAYALQATGDNDRAELAMRRARTLDPRSEQ